MPFGPVAVRMAMDGIASRSVSKAWKTLAKFFQGLEAEARGRGGGRCRRAASPAHETGGAAKAT